MMLRSRLRSGGGSPPPGPPPPTGLPSWMAGKAVQEWVAVPNSAAAYNIDYGYFPTIMGLPNPTTRASPYTNIFSWETNKYGLGWPPSENTRGISSAGGLCSYSGIAFDDRLTRVFRGAGDAQRADAAVHRLTIHNDVPYWDSAIVKPCHKDYIKNPIYPSSSSYPTADPGDDTRSDRMYDGSHRGGHPYFQKQFIKGAIGGDAGMVDSFCMFGNKQWWPTDEGGTADVHVAHLSNGLWRTDNPIPAVPQWQSDDLAWIQKHPVTEDVYAWGKDAFSDNLFVSKWSRTSNTWSTLLSMSWTGALERGSGSIDWTNNYLVFSSCENIGRANRQVWMTDLTTPSKVNVTLTGPYEASFNPYRGGGLCWCPDLGKHLYYNDSGWVLTLEKTGPSTFYVDLLAMTGTGPAAGQAQANKADGQMYSSLQYSPEMQCMVLFISDMDPMYVFRAA